jgi:sodium/bile acid cotransporter 7
MLLAVVLAAIWPAVGASAGVLHLDDITTWGVALVFLLAGASLSRRNLRDGAANWRLHLMVQATTYLLFPAVGAAIALLVHGWLPDDLLLGFFYLCALSSTISTSIAMTTLARGNVAGAIFNASLSSLLGMVLTPLLLSLWLHTGSQQTPLGPQLIKIGRELFLPFALGQLIQPWIAPWISRHKNITSKVDRGVILLIVYNSFCDSTRSGLWTHYGWVTLLQTFLLSSVLLACALYFTTTVARKLGFTPEDEIAAVFCGSKKSLATGVPMAKLLFPAGNSLGLIVLPLMFYHQLQLLVCTVMARRYSERVN